MVAKNRQVLNFSSSSLSERSSISEKIFSKIPSSLPSFQVISIVSHGHRMIGTSFQNQFQEMLVRELKAPVFVLKIFSRENKIRIGWKESLEQKILSERFVDLETNEISEFADRFYALLSHIKKSYRMIVVFIQDTENRELISECLKASERIYQTFTEEPSSIESVKAIHNFARFTLHKKNSRILPVYFLRSSNRGNGTRDIRKKLNLPISRVYRCVLNFHEKQNYEQINKTVNKRFDDQIASWAREIAHTRTGIVFSSGCAKGLAHIGVIQELEEANIPVDAIVGCSMGSVIGALWAYGYQSSDLVQIAKELSLKNPLWKLVDPVFPPRRGVMRGQKVKSILEKYLGGARFSDTSIPLSVVATHLNTLDRVVFNDGEIIPSVMASSAMPGIIEPVVHRGEEYVDGGVIDPLPVGVLKNNEIDRIIAVSVIPSPADVRECSFFFENFPKPHRPIRHWLNKHLNYFYKNNVFDIVMRSFEASTIRVAAEDCARADVVIKAARCQDTWHEFAHPEKFIRLGRNATKKQMSAIQALVS